MESPEINTPTDIIKTNFLETKSARVFIFLAISLLILILTAILTLNYLKVISIKKIVVPPSRFTFSCPVPKEFCSKGKIIKDKDKILGLGFNLPVGTKIYAATSGRIVFGGTEDQKMNIPPHATIDIGITDRYEPYSMHYEYFGLHLPQKERETKTVEQKEELGALWGGSFPQKLPYEGINLIFSVRNEGRDIELKASDFSQ